MSCLDLISAVLLIESNGSNDYSWTPGAFYRENLLITLKSPRIIFL